ncbi:MAG: hypothetical protein IKT70_04880 [Clostridia bacterium]|nr:hypothetical protein [Clostridia bacterium]
MRVKNKIISDGLSEVLEYLPQNVVSAVRELNREDIDEIRLRREGEVSVTCRDENVLMGIIISGREMDELMLKITDGSIYSHANTIRQGYVTLPFGIRVGISGRAVFEGGELSGISDISSLIFRVPRAVRGSGDYIAYLLRRENYRKGVLIYSPPGVGKTTVLRDTCRILSEGENPLRVVVVDTRDEICRGEKFGTVDILRGFSRAEGIEIALRTLSPQLIICDEIGSGEDSNAILSLRHSGVPLLASAHGDNLRELLTRPFICELHRSGIFSGYVGLNRSRGGMEYEYTQRKEVEIR